MQVLYLFVACVLASNQVLLHEWFEACRFSHLPSIKQFDVTFINKVDCDGHDCIDLVYLNNGKTAESFRVILHLIRCGAKNIGKLTASLLPKMTDAELDDFIAAAKCAPKFPWKLAFIIAIQQDHLNAIRVFSEFLEDVHFLISIPYHTNPVEESLRSDSPNALRFLLPHLEVFDHVWLMRRAMHKPSLKCISLLTRLHFDTRSVADEGNFMASYKSEILETIRLAEIARDLDKLLLIFRESELVADVLVRICQLIHLLHGQ